MWTGHIHYKSCVSTGVPSSLNWTRIQRGHSCFRGGTEITGESGQPIRDQFRAAGASILATGCVCFHWIHASGALVSG